MMLNVFLAAAGIGLSFPLGVLLALGRRAGRRTDSIAGGVVLTVLLAAPFLLWLLHRGFAVDDAVSWALLGLTIGLGFAGFAVGRHSTLPIVRVLSVAYIEFFRGVPLFVLLLLGAIAIGFFLPVGMDPPGLVVRAIIVFTVFTAAYLAEIVRGGLQSLPARSDRGRPGARAVTGARERPDRAAPGVAQRDPVDRRPVHLAVQGHHAGRGGDGVPRAARGVRRRHGRSRTSAVRASPRRRSCS